MLSLIFLFASDINFERIEWLSEILSLKESISSNIHLDLQIFITGNAIYSFLDKKQQKLWNRLISNSKIKIYFDSKELDLLGISLEQLLRITYNDGDNKSTLVIKNISNIDTHFNLDGKSLEFWNILINRIKKFGFENNIGLLAFEGPYMHRTSIYVLRLIETALSNNMNVELYSYLDGVHLGHSIQRPSAFENIGETLKRINYISIKKGLKFLMLACSRCGMARGYIKQEVTEEFVNSYDTIPFFLLCNLNKIIDRFEENHIIFSPFSGLIIQPNHTIIQNHNKPPLVIFITHPPYGSEWTFGGISFAMACANHNIKTDVVFIEDGVYSVIGSHKVEEKYAIFNVQEIIDALLDSEGLNFYVYGPSLEKRYTFLSQNIESLDIINKQELSNLLFNNNMEYNQKRILFF